MIELAGPASTPATMPTNPASLTSSRILAVLGLALCGYAVSTPAHAGRPTTRDHRAVPSENAEARPSAAPPTRASRPKTTEASEPATAVSCASARLKGKDVVVRDHRNPSLECKVTDAEHNRDVAKRKLAAAKTAEERARAESGVQHRELALLDAQVAVMKRDYAAASGAEKTALERKLNDAISSLEAKADQAAQQVRGKAEQVRAEAEQRVRALEGEYKRATGKAKAEAHKAYLGAQRTLSRIEQQLVDHDLKQAERKLDAAKARVGQQAQQLRDEAEKKLAQAKKKYDDASKKLKSELAKLENSLKELEKTLGAYQDQAEKALDDAIGEVEDTLDDLLDF